MTGLESFDFVDNLCHWEGVIAWPYLDDKGFVTVGVGNYLPSVTAAVVLPFRLGLRAATAQEVNADFHRVLAMRPGLAALSYKAPTSVMLPEADSRHLLLKRLGSEFLPGLEKMFPGFENFPPPVQRALVDMVYSLGLHGLSAKFPTMCGLVREGKFAAAAKECHRAPPCRPERNAWTADNFLAGALGSHTEGQA